MSDGRAWGYWTSGKLDILRRYLNAFTTASKRVPERIYLDLFAGEPGNVDRFTGEPIEGSAQIALTTDDPPFTRLRFFEMAPRAERLQQQINSRYPARDARVVEGDCNVNIAGALRGLQEWNWAPTFAFIDPNGPHFRWDTIETLSQFKERGLSKVELWVLFPAGLSARMLPVDGGVRDQDAALLTDMYGTDDWRQIYEGRLRGLLSARVAREQYVNLMRWRLETQLNYGFTDELDVVNERGVSMYHMIFATDKDAGQRIMSDLYRRAAVDFPQMRRQVRERRRRRREEGAGIFRLPGLEENLDADVKRGENFYEHTPPTEPWRLPSS